ncbi:MAG: hypothetical protein ACRDTH_29535 [Pseudonocardiaceae bacterium]
MPHEISCLARRFHGEALLAERSAQQSRLAAHQCRPGGFGELGPVGQSEEIVACLDRLTAPHLNAALQVLHHGDRVLIVRFGQCEFKQRHGGPDAPGPPDSSTPRPAAAGSAPGRPG